MMKAFEFGFWLIVGFCTGAVPFCFCAAVVVVAWQEVSLRRRQRMIREGLYDLAQEDTVRRHGGAHAGELR